MLSINDSVVAPAEGLRWGLATRQAKSALVNRLPPLRGPYPLSNKTGFSSSLGSPHPNPCLQCHQPLTLPEGLDPKEPRPQELCIPQKCVDHSAQAWRSPACLHLEGIYHPPSHIQVPTWGFIKNRSPFPLLTTIECPGPHNTPSPPSARPLVHTGRCWPSPPLPPISPYICPEQCV